MPEICVVITLKYYDDEFGDECHYDEHDNYGDQDGKDDELTRVKPQEGHPPGVVGTAHPRIRHNSDKRTISTFYT